MAVAKQKYDSPRQAARRDAILECARSILSDLGYDGLTMRGLAHQAGVATSTLYTLYGNKDDLLLAAVDDLLIELAETTGATHKEGIEAILHLNQVSTTQIQETPQYAQAMTRSLLRTGADSRLVEVLFASSYPFVLQHLEVAKDRREIRDETDVVGIAKLLVGQQWGTVLLWMMGMLTLEQLGPESKRAQVMILTNIARPACGKRLRKLLLHL